MESQSLANQKLEQKSREREEKEEKTVFSNGLLSRLNSMIRSTRMKLLAVVFAVGFPAIGGSSIYCSGVKSSRNASIKMQIQEENGSNPSMLKEKSPDQTPSLESERVDKQPEREEREPWAPLEIVFWIVIFGMTIKGILRTKHVFDSLNWLKEQSGQLQMEAQEIVKEKACRIYVIIPAYKEQAIIEQTMECFASLQYPNLKVVVVTTDKEKQEEGMSTTMDIVKQVAERLDDEANQDIFSLIHYPHSEGGMKEQVNYAAKEISKNLSRENQGESYVAVYNADSRPNPQTFLVFNALVQKKGVEVAVQNSVHFSNFNKLPFTPSGVLLKAASVFQTRWSMEEVSMQRKQAEFWDGKQTPLDLRDTLSEQLAYCIGHGSFFRLDIWNEAGGFPEDCELDDLPLGFLLTCKGISIQPMPLLENCETPSSVTDLIKQKANWYRMMIGYMDPRRVALERNLASRLRIDLITLRSFLRDAVSWGLVSPAILVSLITPLITGSPVHVVASVTGLTLFSLLNTWKIIKEKSIIAELSDGNEINLDTLQKFLVVGATIPYCLIASLGPYNTLIRKILGLDYNDHKTKRQD